MRTCKQQRSRHTVAGCRGVLRGSRLAIMRGSSAIIPAERAALRPRSFRRTRGRPGVDSDLIRKHSAPSSLALLRSYPTVPLSRGPESPDSQRNVRVPILSSVRLQRRSSRDIRPPGVAFAVLSCFRVDVAEFWARRWLGWRFGGVYAAAVETTVVLSSEPSTRRPCPGQ